MINLYTLTYAELTDLLTELGEPGFRARQIWGWMYESTRGHSFDAMGNSARQSTIKKAQRDYDSLGILELSVTSQISHDGTEKRLVPPRPMGS